MCNCLFKKCLRCENKISLHIADFCVSEEAIDILCPECLEKNPTSINPNQTVFSDVIELPYQVINALGEEIGVPGTKVLFISHDEKAYGIHLN